MFTLRDATICSSAISSFSRRWGRHSVIFNSSVRRQESLLRVDLRDNQLSVLSQASLAISEMLTNGKRRFIPVRQ
jgi:hypothetical protein